MFQILALSALIGQVSPPEPKIIIVVPQVKPGEYPGQHAKPGENRFQVQPQGQPADKELADLLKKILEKLEVDNRWAGQKGEVKKEVIRIEKIGGPAQKDQVKELEAARKELEKLLKNLREVEQQTEVERKAAADRARAAQLLHEIQNKLKKEQPSQPKYWLFKVKPGTITGQMNPFVSPEHREAIEMYFRKLNKLPGVPATKNPNQEVIDLLKKAIQKLEGKSTAKPGKNMELKWLFQNLPGKPGQPFELRFEGFRIDNPTQKTSPELEKARAEVRAAEANLHAAKARLANLQGTPKKSDPLIIIQRKPPTPPSADVEQRLDRLIQEIEELRKQIKKGGR